MIRGFEQETQPLTEYEENTLLPVIIAGLRTKQGQKAAVTNRTIVTRLNLRGFDINEARVRKIVNYIRTNDLIPCLIATSSGYCIATSEEELLRYEESLKGREDAIKAVRLAIARQRRIVYEDIHNGKSENF